MKKILLSLLCVGFMAVGSASGQDLLKRVLTRSDKFDFSPGGTISITGAPNGSIKLIGSSKNEIEITADIEISAPADADLNVLAEITGFLVDKTIGRASIISMGTHNKLGSKSAWKKFPKRLLNLPFRIDYTVSVPHYADLEVDGGKGDLDIAGIEGSMRINFLDTKARV